MRSAPVPYLVGMNLFAACYLPGCLLLAAPAQAQKPPAAPALELLYPAVDRMPRLPNGDSTAVAIEAAIRARLTYRPAASTDSQFGEAFVTYTVGTDGRVRDVRVRADDEPAFAQAVLAATRQLPRFTPGRLQGQAVPVRYTLMVGLLAPSQINSTNSRHNLPADLLEMEKLVPVPPRLVTGQSFSEALYADLTRHPLPPAKTADISTRGRPDNVAFSFTVDETGHIRELLAGGTADLAHYRAATQALARLPAFVPGRNSSGQAVAVYVKANVPFPLPGAPVIPAVPVPTVAVTSRSRGPAGPSPAARKGTVPGSSIVAEEILWNDPRRPSAAAATPAPFDPNKVYTYVEQMPVLPTGGGFAGLVEAIQQRVVLPAGATCQGKAYVSFVVKADGNVDQTRIVKGLAVACDAAVLTAVRQLPRFAPGMQNGVAVAVAFTVPVTLPLPASK